MLCKRDTMSLQPNISPYGRWHPLGCKWHSRKHQGGGTLCLHSMGSHPRSFSLPLLPLTSGSWGRQRHWFCLQCYRHALRHEGLRQTFSARQPGKFSNVWPLWWPWRGKMLWRPTGEEPGPSPTPVEEATPQEKKMSHQKHQALPPGTQAPPGL